MLTKIRLIVTKNYVIMPLCCLLLFFTSCTRESALTSGFNTKNYNGESLFRGLILGAGEVAKQIPEINKIISTLEISPIEAKAVTDLQDELIASVNKLDPSFLTTFKTEIQSGDRSLITKAFADSKVILTKALGMSSKIPARLLDKAFLENLRKQLPEDINETNLKSIINSKKQELKASLATKLQPVLGVNKLSRYSGLNVNVNVNININAVAVAAVAVAVAVIVIVIVLAADSLNSMPYVTGEEKSSSLLKEQIVNSIANRLSVR